MTIRIPYIYILYYKINNKIRHRKITSMNNPFYANILIANYDVFINRQIMILLIYF